MLTGLLLLAVSAALLVWGAELFVENLTGAARRLGVSTIAAALVLAGAEPEEMITAVIAAMQDRPALAAGDAIGANLTMLTLAIGLAALLRPLPFGPRVRTYAFGAALTGGAAALVLADGKAGRIEGGILVVAYVTLVGVVWAVERRPPPLGELAELDEPDEQPTGRAATLALMMSLAGLAVMIVGGNVAVAGAVRVVDELEASDTAVGLTLLALATTAELLALAWASARRDVGEIAVAGVIGSAAYNATMSLGVAALARPLSVDGFLVPALAAAALPLVVVALAWRGRLGRVPGLLLLAGYACYVLIVSVTS